MDPAQGLISPVELESEDGSASCPGCGEAWADLPPVIAELFPDLPLRRCSRCGRRWSCAAPEARRLVDCDRCGLPFLGPETDAEVQSCPGCRKAPSTDVSDREIVGATETEVLRALEDSWRFVGSPALLSYLDRLSRHVAGEVDGAPPDGRVAILDHPSLLTLALPSGKLVISLGTLANLKDEAELAFVLGHELAHVASGEAAAWLVRLGMRSVARGPAARGRKGWSAAAMDLIRLGYGSRREHDADARALDAILALDYDPESVKSYLGRIRQAAQEGTNEFAELVLAHPPAVDRLRRIESQRCRRVQGRSAARTGREVFRRAAGHSVLATGLPPFAPFAPLTETDATRDARPSKARLWIVMGMLLVTVLLLLLVLR